MTVRSIVRRLGYHHKLSALPYFLRDVRLIFALPSMPTKMHVSSVIERATRENIVEALHNFLPEWFQEHCRRQGWWDKQGFRLILYLLVRKWKPGIVVETGVAEGLSSAYILSAMHENGSGRLYSIDLPPEQAAARQTIQQGRSLFQLEDGQTHQQFQPGYFVPERVRDRWTLILGDSRQELPPLLEKLGRIDVFFHDSLHTFEHMQWEYETAWPHINGGGLLLSHDVLWNKAFLDKCKHCRGKPLIFRSLGILEKTCPMSRSE